MNTEVNKNKLLDKDFWRRAKVDDITRAISEGANVHGRDESGATPLHFATVLSKTPEMIMPLFDAGADIRVSDNNGKTPLHLATAFSNGIKQDTRNNYVTVR